MPLRNGRMTPETDPLEAFTLFFGLGFAVLIGLTARRPLLGLGVGAANLVLAVVAGWLTPRMRAARMSGIAWFGTALPLLVFFAFYREAMLVLASGHLVWRDAELTRLEHGLTWTVPTLHSPFLGEWLAFAYMAYVPMLLFASWLLFGVSGRDASSPARSMVRAVCVTWACCFVLYLLFPVLGPRFLEPSIQLARLGNGPFSRAAIENQQRFMLHGGAFPSAHVAASVVTLAALWVWRRGWLWIFVPLVANLVVAAVYLNYHYAIDALVGGVLGVAVFLADLRFFGRGRGTGREELATAITEDG
jgi:membrane-associated phospholipid phosphatase